MGFAILFAIIAEITSVILMADLVGGLGTLALLALAGVLLIIPGFLTDALALLLLVPFVRGPVAGALVNRVRAHVVTVVGPMNQGGPGDVIDTTATEVRPPARPELP